MEHRPRGLIAAQTQNALETQCAHAMFLVGHVPGSGQPDLQRSASLVKNGSGRDRTLIPAGAAHEPTSTGPVRFSSDTALRTHKSIAPTKAFQILQTCFVRREPFQELAPRFRVVLPRGWEIFVVVHGEILPYGGANRIPRMDVQYSSPFLISELPLFLLPPRPAMDMLAKREHPMPEI